MDRTSPIGRYANLRCLASPHQYKSDADPRGYAVIINMSRVMGLDDRVGSEHDVRKLQVLFTKLHFEVRHHENLSATELHETLRDISKEDALRSHDCFVLVLMSHGRKGQICASDGNKINLKETFWMFSNEPCRGLRGKPKLFFIQACSGSKEDPGVEMDATDISDSLTKLPAISDMLVAKPSISGYVSYRNTRSGSRFIQSLVDVFDEYVEELDVTRMMQKVTGLVQQRAHKYTQCPIFTSTLSKDLYLCSSAPGCDLSKALQPGSGLHGRVENERRIKCHYWRACAAFLDSLNLTEDRKKASRL